MAYQGGFGFGFGLTPWVRRLLIANAVVFLLQKLSPQLTTHLWFVPSEILRYPWTLISYMFAHGGFGHLFWNMVGLFFFGPPLEGRWGSREFLKFYFICGMGGAALSFFFAPHSAIIGASAAVYGIMLAFAMNWPDAPIYIWGILPVKAKYLVGVIAIFSVMSMMNTGAGDNIAHAAHLGGFAAAFFYMRINRPGGMFGGFRKMMNKRKLRVVQDEQPRRPTRTGPPPSPRRGANAEEDRLLDELDRVLEKISTEGMSSLTAQERRLLDEVSRRYRTD